MLVAVAAGFFPAGKLEEMVNVGTLFAFILVSAGVLVLRRTRPDLERGFKVPLVPLVPILAILACLWLMLNLTALTWVRFLVWMALGVLVYFVYSRRTRCSARPARAGPSQNRSSNTAKNQASRHRRPIRAALGVRHDDPLEVGVRQVGQELQAVTVARAGAGHDVKPSGAKTNDDGSPATNIKADNFSARWTGEAQLRLRWSSANQSQQVVPKEQLYTN